MWRRPGSWDPVRIDRVTVQNEPEPRHARPRTRGKPIRIDRVTARHAAQTVGGKQPRKVVDEPLRWSQLEKIERLARLTVLWETAEHLEDRINSERVGGGRRREHSIADWILFETCGMLLGSHREAERTLRDRTVWRRLRKVTRRAWPDHPNRRLGPKPISRSQHHYFREQHFNPTTGNPDM